MFAIQSWIITVWHNWLLLVLLLRCHLLLILLILMHLPIGLLLFLSIVCHVRLLHNKRTVGRLHPQMLFRVLLLLLLVNNVRHLLLLSMFVKTWIRVDYDRTTLNDAWLFLLLIACRSSSFTLLVHLSMLAVHRHVAVHLLLLQHLTWRAVSLHICRCACWLRWNVWTLLSWFRIACHVLSLMWVKFAVPSKFWAFSCSSTARQFLLRRWCKRHVLLLRVSSCMVHRWHSCISSIIVRLNLALRSRSQVLRWLRLAQNIILINMSRRNTFHDILASLRIRLLSIGRSINLRRKSLRLLQGIISCCYQFHNLMNRVRCSWLVDLDSIGSSYFCKLWASCNMLDKRIEISLNFAIGLGISCCRDSSFECASCWFEKL